MTIEEAIKHCEDVANHCDNEQCSLDHIQLKEWLVELVERRNQPTKQEMIKKAVKWLNRNNGKRCKWLDGSPCGIMQ